MEAVTKIIGAVVLVLLLLVIMALLISVPLWLLWNWLIPVVFPGEGIAHSITLLQAFGIALFSGILFKSASSK